VPARLVDVQIQAWSDLKGRVSKPLRLGGGIKYKRVRPQVGRSF
jgi:hypothetical protein